MGAAALVTALAGVLCLALRQISQTPSARSGEAKTSSSTPRLSLNADRGRQMAQIYCQSCHFFPEPALLDKATWEHGALPDMAPWLGLAKPKLETRRDGEVIDEANVFPPSPIISPEDWLAIRHYYNEAAPEQPVPQWRAAARVPQSPAAATEAR